MTKHKIMTLDALGEHCQALKAEGKKIAHCHGVFDLLHPGHLKHFEAARKFGDVLVVTLTEDKFVNKGPGRPVFNEQIRSETLAAIQFIDYVAINRAPMAIPAIEAIQPDAYVKGQDYKNAVEDITGGIIKEKNAVESFGGELVFTEEIQFSSSKLINRHLDDKDEVIKDFLKKIRENYGYQHFVDRFAEIEKLRVLVIGDIILDEYQFVSPLGKSSKSATITAKKLNTDIYAGGVLAVANHVADFVESVDLVTTYGINDGINYRDFILENLHQRVRWHGVHLPERPTTLKRRFVDKVFNHKLFEIYEYDDSPMSETELAEVVGKIEALTGQYDMILVADFGHSILDRQLVKYLTELPTFIAVNSQTNSGNKGYNLLTKYPRCDYFSIDKQEAHLAFHDKFANIVGIQKWLMEQTQAQIGAITLGRSGSLVRTKEDERSVQAPILSNEVVDTIGAGDAFLAITSLLARLGSSPEELAFVGNSVGAMAVRILGNKSFIEKTPLLKYIKTLLS